MITSFRCVGAPVCMSALLWAAVSVWAQPASQPATPPAAPEVPALFIPANSPRRPVPPPPQAVQSRPVVLDTRVLGGLRPAGKVKLDPFPGMPLTGIVDGVTVRTPTRYTVTGRLAEDPLGSFIIVLEEDAVAGLIQSPGTQNLLRIDYHGEGVHLVSRVDPARYGGCGAKGRVRKPAPAAPAAVGAAQDAVSTSAAQQSIEPSSTESTSGVTTGTCSAPQPVFDVLIAYTTAVRQAAGGTNAIAAQCQLAIDTADQGFANSFIDARYRLVYRREVAYDENGDFSDHLSRLNDANDSVLGVLHTLRESYKADFVSLWVNDDDGGSLCGLANCTVDDSDPYSVVNWTCAVSNFSFHHEIGHTQGCNHDRDNSTGGCAEDSYSYGWRWFGTDGKGYRSIMAYDTSPGQYTRVNYFSNPYVNYVGRATGVAIGQDNESYNAKTINDRRFTFENHRYSGFDVWVDYAAGPIGIGSFALPFNSASAGRNAIVVSSTASETPVLHIKAGASKAESITLDKPMFVKSCGGAARIGG